MKLLLGILLHLTGFVLLAQNPISKNHEFSFSLGTWHTKMENLPNYSDFDFLNYFENSPGEYLYEPVAKLDFRFNLNTHWSADVQLRFMSDLMPNYDIAAYYHFNNHLAIGLGSNLITTYYFSGFEQFKVQSFPDYYTDENWRQFSGKDLSFYLSPALKLITSDRFQTVLKLDVGLSSFLKEEQVFYFKRKLSNERLRYHYKTRLSFQPFMNPKIEMRLRAFNIDYTSVGLLLRSNLYYSQRAMNYYRTIQSWMHDNATIETVRSPRHTFTRYEAEIGIFVRW